MSRDYVTRYGTAPTVCQLCQLPNAIRRVLLVATDQTARALRYLPHYEVLYHFFTSFTSYTLLALPKYCITGFHDQNLRRSCLRLLVEIRSSLLHILRTSPLEALSPVFPLAGRRAPIQRARRLLHSSPIPIFRTECLWTPQQASRPT